MSLTEFSYTFYVHHIRGFPFCSQHYIFLQLVMYPLSKPGDRRNFNTHKTCLNYINDERSTGKKHTTVEWDDSGKLGQIINEF